MIKKSIIALATVASMGVATTASADHWFFAEHMTQDASSIVELGSFASPGDGTVEIYDYRLGEVGELLGSETVHRGANSDVRINVGTVPLGNLMAILKVDGEVVGDEMIRINSN